MMKLDNAARYRASHEWARREGDEIVVGISDHAQHSLGDIVFIDLPLVGRLLEQGAVFGVAESVKAASDLYIPMSGTVTAVNAALAEHPESVNKDCYGDGWLIRLAPTKPAEWDGLLTAEAYRDAVGEA